MKNAFITLFFVFFTLGVHAQYFIPDTSLNGFKYLQDTLSGKLNSSKNGVYNKSVISDTPTNGMLGCMEHRDFDVIYRNNKIVALRNYYPYKKKVGNEKIIMQYLQDSILVNFYPNGLVQSKYVIRYKNIYHIICADSLVEIREVLFQLSEEGALLSRTHVKNGKGMFFDYDFKGNIIESGTLLNGLKEGYWTEYDDCNGQTIMILRKKFSNGKFTGEKQQYPQCIQKANVFKGHVKDN